MSEDVRLCPCCEARANRQVIFYNERLRAELGRTWADDYQDRRRREIAAECINRRRQVSDA